MSKTFIHPTAIVETKSIGKDVHIGPFCYINERVIIEDNCKILGHASIGNPAQYKVPRFKDAGNPVIIGKGTEIREFVTINLPTYGITSIGKNCLLMANVHIPHDCKVGNDVIFVVGAAIGGRSKIGNYCYFGLNATMHNVSEIGDYSMIGANSFFKGKAPGGLIWVGTPAKAIKINIVGIERNAPVDQQEKLILEARKSLKWPKSEIL